MVGETHRPVRPMREQPRGLYEQLITAALHARLDALGDRWQPREKRFALRMLRIGSHCTSVA
jgi:hypothetical protein